MADDQIIKDAVGAVPEVASPLPVEAKPVDKKAGALPNATNAGATPSKNPELTEEQKRKGEEAVAKWGLLIENNPVIKAIMGLLKQWIPGFGEDAKDPTVAKNPAHMRIMEELRQAAYSNGSVVNEARVENQYIAAIDKLIASKDIKLDADPVKAAKEYEQLVVCIKENINGPDGAVKIDQNEIAKKMKDFGAEFKDPAKPVRKENGGDVYYGAKVEIEPDYLKRNFNEGSSLYALKSDGKGGITMEAIDNYGSQRDLDMLGGKGFSFLGGGGNDKLNMERVFVNKKDPVTGKISQENQGIFVSKDGVGFYVGTDAIKDEAKVSLLEKLKPNAPQDPAIANPALNVTNKPAAPGMVAGP